MRALRTTVILLVAGCGGTELSGGLVGRVADTAREPVAGAAIFAVPAELVVWSPLKASDVKSAMTLDYDEPLESLIESSGTTFPQTVTNDKGEYALALPPGRFYFYVVPDPKGDPVHLPGGSASRQSLMATLR